MPAISADIPGGAKFSPELTHSTEMMRYNGNVVMEGIIGCCQGSACRRDSGRALHGYRLSICDPL